MRNLPFIILAVFIFTIPWQDIVYLPGNLTVSRLVGLALIVAGLGSFLKGRFVKIRRPSLMLFLTVLFVLWTALSGLWSVSLNGALASLTYIQLAIMVWLIWDLCRTKEQHLILLQAFVFGAYILAGSTVYGYLTNPFVPNSMQNMERYTGIGGNANGIAAIMALGLSLAWYLSLVQRSSLLRWVNLLYLPTAVLGIILTASRGGAVLAVIGLAVIPLTYGYLNRLRKVVLAVAIAVMTVTVINLVPSANVTRLAETSSEITEGNVSNRSQIWAAGLEAYSEKPFFGVGVGGFVRATTPILGYSDVAHNAYILVLTEMGVIGILLFLSILIVTLLPLLRLPALERTIYGFLWLALVVSLMPSNDEDAQHVWALLAMMTTRNAYVLTFSNSANTLSAVPTGLRRLLGQGARERA